MTGCGMIRKGTGAGKYGGSSFCRSLKVRTRSLNSGVIASDREGLC